MSLDGELYSLGESYLPVDTPSIACVRARIVVPTETEVCAVSGFSALWVHGVCEMPLRHSVCLRAKKRANHSVLDSRIVRSLSNVKNEFEPFNGVAVLSLTRALVEVLSDPLVTDDLAVDVLRRAGVARPGIRDLIRMALDFSPRGGYTGLATARSALADAVDVVDGVDTPNSVENAFELHHVGHLENKSAQSQPA
jgi:hypothetical protein